MKNTSSIIVNAAIFLSLQLVTGLFIPGGATSQVLNKKTVSTSIDTISTNIQGTGIELIIEFKKGPEHNHPLMAVWIEDMDGNYIQTLYVARSIATGIFSFGQKTEGKWQPGEISRPAALPYWMHKRNIVNNKGSLVPSKGYEVPDAYSGATPVDNFTLYTRTDKTIDSKFRILFEINQSWDWNEYWTNTKYPDDEEYKTSSQPAVVYAAEIDPHQMNARYKLTPIGRSHYSGADGNLYHDLETLTTALRIASEITVTVLPQK